MCPWLDTMVLRCALEPNKEELLWILTKHLRHISRNHSVKYAKDNQNCRKFTRFFKRLLFEGVPKLKKTLIGMVLTHAFLKTISVELSQNYQVIWIIFAETRDKKSPKIVLNIQQIAVVALLYHENYGKLSHFVFWFKLPIFQKYVPSKQSTGDSETTALIFKRCTHLLLRISASIHYAEGFSLGCKVEETSGGCNKKSIQNGLKMN